MDGVLRAIMRAAVFLLSREVNIIRGPVMKRMRAMRMARWDLAGAFGVCGAFGLAPRRAAVVSGCKSNSFMPTGYPRSRRLPIYFENLGSKTFNIFRLFWFLEGCGRFCVDF